MIQPWRLTKSISWWNARMRCDAALQISNFNHVVVIVANYCDTHENGQISTFRVAPKLHSYVTSMITSHITVALSQREWSRQISLREWHRASFLQESNFHETSPRHRCSYVSSMYLMCVLMFLCRCANEWKSVKLTRPLYMMKMGPQHIGDTRAVWLAMGSHALLDCIAVTQPATPRISSYSSSLKNCFIFASVEVASVERCWR